MRQAQIQDIEIVANILSNAYVDNPTVDLLFKSSPSLEQKKRLFSLIAKEQIMLERAYLTSDNQGVAVYHRSQFAKRKPLQSFLIRLRIMLQISGPKRAITSMLRQKKVERSRKKEPHIFFWILAVNPKNRGLDPIVEIKDHIFALSYKYQIPIFAETPLERTKNLYLRYGFTEYDAISFDEGYSIHLLERQPTSIPTL